MLFSHFGHNIVRAIVYYRYPNVSHNITKYDTRGTENSDGGGGGGEGRAFNPEKLMGRRRP